ncbi:hypothetical protein [Hyphomicrobium sp. DY-1]|uniref:hypothetical protein n=1 Tax=Hyphomicrobium sp. DY-1 TaxID=3075650 RepID=UPI0039C10C8D
MTPDENGGNIDDMLSNDPAAPTPDEVNAEAGTKPTLPPEALPPAQQDPKAKPKAPLASIGRIVHFYSDTTVDGHKGPFAAIVTGVDDTDNGLISIKVFAKRNSFDQERVAPNIGNENQSRYWEFPPRV